MRKLGSNDISKNLAHIVTAYFSEINKTEQIMKKLLLIVTAVAFVACGNGSSSQYDIKVTKTGRVELASVCAQTTFKIDNSGITGDRFGIYRSGRCEFTAYINMEEITWNADSIKGSLIIYCPKVLFKEPKYHFDEMATIYQNQGMLRDRITQTEKHDVEMQKLKELQDSLSNNEVFRNALIEKAHLSATLLLPRLLTFDNSLSTIVKFKD
ncbi:MAG: DUF4230 domain-containing protein [Prevotella sp.]|nr:DUF4230 domain-containing protein [Prevotella sp.]